MSPTDVARRRNRAARRARQQKASYENLARSPRINDPKELYSAARTLQARESVQNTWPRIHQADKADYETQLTLQHAEFEDAEFMPTFDASYAFGEENSRAYGAVSDTSHNSGKDQPALTPREGTVLETFEGLVEQIDGDIAFVTLKSEHGDTLYGKYAASELAKLGIHERRRFECRTIDEGGSVRVNLTAIEDVPVTAEDEQTIDQKLDELLSDDPLNGDY